jgi:transcriptional regulator
MWEHHAMYIPPVDAGIDQDEWRAFVVSQGFGQLVSAGRGREVPVVVATQFVLDGEALVLHLAAGNPVFEAIAEQPRVLLSVAGDWAYIPSDWKTLEGEDPALGLPTTYYGAVQLIGTATVLCAPEAVAAVLRLQLETYQPGVEIADPSEAHPAKLAGIRAIRIAIEDVRAKFKFANNVDAEHRQAVVARLRARARAGDGAAASHVLRRLRASQPSPSNP